MSPEQFEILAEIIAEEEVASFDAKEIVPILEFLWDQGVDLTIVTQEEEVIFFEDEL
jgi:hypothetical protein